MTTSKGNVLDEVFQSFKVIMPTYKATSKVNKQVAAKPAVAAPFSQPAPPKPPERLKGFKEGLTFRILEKKSDNHPYLKKVKSENAFKLKTDHNNVIAEVLLLEGLRDELKKAPDEAVVFHMNGRNDFSSWIKDSIGDWWLGSRIEKLDASDASATKASLIKLLDERISKLKAC